MELVKIIVENEMNTGEHTTGTDKEFRHSYVSCFYEENFLPYKDKKISILEIGTCTGASLLMWKKYFSNGTVSGIDVENKVISKFYDKDINYYYFNAYAEENVNTLENYDIIIDDGPHTLDSQISFINLYYNKLKEGGLMIIEDIDEDFKLHSLIEEMKKKFNKEPSYIDNRDKTSLSNEILLWIKK